MYYEEIKEKVMFSDSFVEIKISPSSHECVEKLEEARRRNR